MTPDPAAALPTIAAARVLLDDALVAAREIGNEDVPAEPVAGDLAEALRCVYVALASLGDARAFHDARALAVDATAQALERLQRAIVSDDVTDGVARRVAQALRLLVVGALPVLDPAPELPRPGDRRPPARATLDEPRLLDLRREVLRPSVPLPDRPPPEEPERDTEVPPERVTDLAALREEARAALRALDAADDGEATAREPPPPAEPPAWDPERAERALFGERLTAMDVLFDRARGLLEDLGAFGIARRPMEDEPWWCPRTESRLLTRVDALAACGEAVVPWLVRLLEERPVPDPELTWAVVLLFGCIAGDDAADQAMRVARVTPADDPELREALGDAFTHAPHPRLPERLRPWLADPSPGRRYAAVVALGRRGLLGVDELAAHAADGDPAVARAAVECLGASQADVPGAVIARALAHPDESVLRAALDAAVRQAPDLAVARATELLRAGEGDRADAAMHVAVGAGEDGVALLHGMGELTPVRCEALGWYGHAASVGALLHALSSKDEATVAAAAGALWRITGAPLTDDDPDPELDPGPFSGATWEDDELPEAPESLSVDPALWSAWWERRAAGVDPAVRWRYGRPWRVADGARVLAAQTSRPRDRRWAALELVARTGRRLPFDAWRFIPRQLEQIAAWREAAARGRARSSWPVQGEDR